MVTTRSGAAAATQPTASSSSSATMTTTTSTNPAAAGVRWLHAPDSTTMFWFAVSLPLVIWDSIYVLGRPHTMEGGWLFWPLYVPYKLYGEVDHVYGWKSYNARNGFTSAQGSLNVVETAMYLGYLWLWLTRAREVYVAGRGNVKVLSGRPAAVAVLLAFTAAIMTLSKTVLYCTFALSLGTFLIGGRGRRGKSSVWPECHVAASFRRTSRRGETQIVVQCLTNRGL